MLASLDNSSGEPSPNSSLEKKTHQKNIYISSVQPEVNRKRKVRICACLQFWPCFKLRCPVPHIECAYFESSTGLSTHFHGLSHFIPSIIIQMGSINVPPILHMRKLKLREIKTPFSKVTGLVSS